MSVGKRSTTFTEYTGNTTFTKYHVSTYFLRKIIFHFPPRKDVIFSRKRNAIFPDDTRKIIFQCDIFGKTIFSEHLKKISNFHIFFRKRSSFIFGLKNKIIFSGKGNIIFPNDTRNIMFQWDFFGKIIFSEHLEKENMIFPAVYTHCINLVKAIMRHQNLLLACRELPKLALSYHIKNMKELLASGILFAVNRYDFFMEKKNMIITFCTCKPLKNDFEPHQNFIGSY